MREAMVIDWNGFCLHGTSHIANSGRPQRGILFFNSGTLPRSSRGDLSVQLADSLADQGFAAFRFDLPGLGDSQGDLPGRYIEVYRHMQTGGYAQCGAELARKLMNQFGLTEMSLLGICGGALTSVFTAAQLGSQIVPRLVLLDLPFFLYESAPASDGQRPRQGLYDKFTKSVKSAKAKLHDWVLNQSWEPYATAAYRRMRTLAAIAVPKRRLPPNANLKLLQLFTNLLEGGTSVLLVTAQQHAAPAPGFDYLAYLQKRNLPRLHHTTIFGTTHSFVEGGGREAVIDRVGKWLATPLGSAPEKAECAPTGMLQTSR